MKRAIIEIILVLFLFMLLVVGMYSLTRAYDEYVQQRNIENESALWYRSHN